jgi:16S rRNA (uracil1498-N3)-methyltransferase
VPEVAPLVDLPHFLGEAPASGELRLMLDPLAERRLSELPKPSGPVTLLVGPEGGFEDGEVVAAKLAGFAGIRLGPRILRTETAGLAVLAAMMALWGDF